MSVHPKFNEDSNCGNCAAFSGEIDKNGSASGECHRFAPRPSAVRVHSPAGNLDREDEPRTYPDTIIWPNIEFDAWCMDWFPRKDTPGGAKP